jgi:hypothetical protein
VPPEETSSLGEHREEEVAVHPRDVRHLDLLGAGGLALADVGAVPKPAASIAHTIASARFSRSG